MTQIPDKRSGSERLKAIFEPSGDHAGDRSPVPPVRYRRIPPFEDVVAIPLSKTETAI
jgi:hypothetical protein